MGYKQIAHLRGRGYCMILSPRLWAVLAGGILLGLLPLLADDNQTDEALSVARSWVAEIDAGQYEQSYLDGGTALHEKVPEDTWIQILKTERPLLGKIISRQETSHSYRPDGYEGAEGEFMTVSYHSSFENKPAEVEHIVLRREDGKWRGVGYNFGPEEIVNDPDAGPNTITTSVTNAPPVPTPAK
jgi:hypothetical protein